MNQSGTIKSANGQVLPWFQIRIWVLSLLVLLVAIAIADIQDYGRKEPALIALASVGYLGYGLVGWLGWLWIRRFKRVLGSMLVVMIYSIAMAELFFIATITYLAIEHVYLSDRLF